MHFVVYNLFLKFIFEKVIFIDKKKDLYEMTPWDDDRLAISSHHTNYMGRCYVEWICKLTYEYNSFVTEMGEFAWLEVIMGLVVEAG